MDEIFSDIDGEMLLGSEVCYMGLEPAACLQQAGLPCGHVAEVKRLRFGPRIQATKLLREREATEGCPRLPVISCSGMSSLDGSKFYACGADEVWNKPFPSYADGSLQRSVARLIPQHVVEWVEPVKKD